MEAEEDPVAVHDPMMDSMHHDDDDDDDDDVVDDTMIMHHHHDVHMDFLDQPPTREEIFEMKRASKRPSEWLKLLCKEWAEENLQLVESMDHRFMEYKPYLKGFISSQLLCRLCIPTTSTTMTTSTTTTTLNSGVKRDHDGSPVLTNISNNNNCNTNDPPIFDFWKILNVGDEFDKAYIIAQVEKFCTLYQIRSGLDVLPAAVVGGVVPGTATAPAGAHTPEAAAAAAAGAAVAAANGQYLSPETTAAALAAAQMAANKAAATTVVTTPGARVPVIGGTITSTTTTAGRRNTAIVASVAASAAVDAVTQAQRMARDAERALEHERRQSAKREQKRQSRERKMEKQREREQIQIKKTAEKIAREVSREEKRKRRIEMREQRERFAQQQKEAALKRAAELVASNRVPIEITRGAAAAKEAAEKALQQLGATTTGIISPTVDVPQQVVAAHSDGVEPVPGPKKQRSAIVVSTASDLHQIVTHSKNLWAKYNAIAKEHNQKVNWITIAKELGIHVKVREKYARMHSRAEQRGFDWVAQGHWKIKDHPEIFVEPTPAEQKARMPPPPPDASTTVLISELETSKEPQVIPQQMQQPQAQDKSEGYDYIPCPRVEDDGPSSHTDPHHDHHPLAMGVDDAAIAVAAAVVDATGVGTHMATTTSMLGAHHSPSTTATNTNTMDV